MTLHFQAQRDAVRNEWQKFLNLCICQETHLDNVEEFKKVNIKEQTPQFGVCLQVCVRRYAHFISLSSPFRVTHSGFIQKSKNYVFVLFPSTKWRLSNCQRH